MKLVKADTVTVGQTLINIGKVEKAEQFPDSIDNQPAICFTVTKGICVSCAFYWVRSKEKLWIED